MPSYNFPVRLAHTSHRLWTAARAVTPPLSSYHCESLTNTSNQLRPWTLPRPAREFVICGGIATKRGSYYDNAHLCTHPSSVLHASNMNTRIPSLHVPWTTNDDGQTQFQVIPTLTPQCPHPYFQFQYASPDPICPSHWSIPQLPVCPLAG